MNSSIAFAFARPVSFSWSCLVVLALSCVLVARGEDTSAPSAKRPAIVSLTDLPVLPDKEEGEGKVAPDKEKDAWLWVNRIPPWLNRQEIALGDKTCKTWLLMVHGSLSWTYALNGEYRSLVTDLAQHDGTKAHLRIFGDGKQLYDAGYLPPIKHPITAVVDLRGVKTLKISVADVEDGIPWNDKVFFGNPVLIRRTLARWPILPVMPVPLLRSRKSSHRPPADRVLWRSRSRANDRKPPPDKSEDTHGRLVTVKRRPWRLIPATSTRIQAFTKSFCKSRTTKAASASLEHQSRSFRVKVNLP